MGATVIDRSAATLVGLLCFRIRCSFALLLLSVSWSALCSLVFIYVYVLFMYARNNTDAVKAIRDLTRSSLISSSFSPVSFFAVAVTSTLDAEYSCHFCCLI